MGPVKASNTGHQFQLIGNVVEEMLKWGLAIHDSHYGLIKDNVACNGSVGANFLATGWGALREGESFLIYFRKVEVPLVEKANCNDAISYKKAITENMLCAGFDAGGRDSCQGDSGGPVTRGTGNTVLAGIISWGTGCARANRLGVYTRVSRVRDLIQNND